MPSYPSRGCVLAAALLPFTFALGLLSPAEVSAQQIIRVPAEKPNLQEAIAAANDGAVIEVASGTYSAPGGAISIDTSASKASFTIRAAAGAQVVLSGDGAHDIIRFANGSGGGSPVTFQGITFVNGVSNTNFIGGAVTLVHANAIFISCAFRNNAANPSISGGAALWLDSSSASFQDCEWRDNTSKNYGAALSALESKAFFRGCSFINNRVNLPGHSSASVGGALVNTNSVFRIDNCRFENNRAGYVGGAIFVGAEYREPTSKPSSELTVTNSLFIGNAAAPDPSVGSLALAIGGAVHLEDQTNGRFVNCRFVDNRAEQGGAISSYRGNIDVDGCVFTANLATNPGGHGGSIFADSSDVPDPSTNYGTINRAPLALTIRDSLFQGPSSGGVSAAHGGAIYVSGDLNCAYGRRGMTQNGTEASNRTPVTLTRVTFKDLATSGTGGAFSGEFVELTMDRSIIENCGTANDGGGLRLQLASNATVTNSTIAHCRAGTMGGGLMLFGGHLDLSHCNLVENQITGSGRGAALVTGPAGASDGVPDHAIEGMVTGCTFSNNAGAVTIYDGERSTAPFNNLQYEGNTIFVRNPADVYISDISGPATVAQLNARVVRRVDGTVTIKSPSVNFAATAPVEVGAILLTPAMVAQSGAPGEAVPIPSQLTYVSAGGTATLDGSAQRANIGVVPTVFDKAHTLTVGGSSFTTTPIRGAPVNISTRLRVGTGDSALIGGFIVQGTSPKRVLIRATGPSLGALGLQGALSDPKLDLYDSGGGVIASNDNWRSTQTGGAINADQAIEIHGTGIAPSTDFEPAIIATLSPNVPYTAAVRGVNGATGAALVEVYDLDGPTRSRLANISTRGSIQTGDNVMIGGFIYGGGPGATNIVLRGIGPSLAGAVSSPLADPVLEVRNANGATIATNDDWQQSQSREIEATGLQPTNKSESAVLLNDLTRGGYTAIVRGRNGGTGVGLVEVYVF